VLVGQHVVVHEEPGRDVEGYKDVNGIVLMSGKNEEDPKHVANPGERVQEVDPSGGVLGDEKVQQGERDGVPGEHVVSTGSDTLQ
jgi:hypothetical protein